jgi:hypothetical protein
MGPRLSIGKVTHSSLSSLVPPLSSSLFLLFLLGASLERDEARLVGDAAAEKFCCYCRSTAAADVAIMVL